MHQKGIFVGDNLTVLREKTELTGVDMIYLDPPYNSGRDYNLAPNSDKVFLEAYEDTWSWGPEAQKALQALGDPGNQKSHLKLAQLLNSLIAVGVQKGTMAYLCMMVPRLIEMHRILKDTGTLYLHCDPSASHYLKMVLDVLFGPDNFRSEIIWKRTSAHNSSKVYGPIHDVILYYTKGAEYTWNPHRISYTDEYIRKTYSKVDETGRRWKSDDLTGPGVRTGESGQPWRGYDPSLKGRHWRTVPAKLDELLAAGQIHWSKNGVPSKKLYFEEVQGLPPQDIILDINPVKNGVLDGQKPEELLTRLISISTNKGDTILDPFLGSGTTAVAAEKLERSWFGIERNPQTKQAALDRLLKEFGEDFNDVVEYAAPETIEEIRSMAALPKGRLLVEYWVMGALKGIRNSKGNRGGSDDGWDGSLTIGGMPHNKARTLLVSCKSGESQNGQEVLKEVTLFNGKLEKQKKADPSIIGGVITCFKSQVRKSAQAEVLAYGTYEDADGEKHPRLQIVSFEDILALGPRAVMAPKIIDRKEPPSDFAEKRRKEILEKKETEAERLREQEIFEYLFG